MQLLTPADAAGRVTAALKSAAEATGAGFDYLYRTATRESSMNTTAQSPSSSARGLFQFIDSTWLQVLKEEGPKLGMSDAAADVSKTSSGRYTVRDPARRAELLAMRDDPQAAALIAGAFTKRNAETLSDRLGRAPTEGELYAAHFLGARGASELVSLAASAPETPAAGAFPAQASANRAVFFDKGRPRTALELYDKLTSAPKGAVADASAPTARVAVVRARPEAEEPRYNNGVENDGSAFHSMFKTGRRAPVSAYVAQAWSAFGDAGSVVADVSSSRVKSTAAMAQAYAPQPAAAATTPAGSRAEAAVAAVNAAAVSKPRRAAAVANPKAAAKPSAPQARRDAAAMAVAERFAGAAQSKPGQAAGAQPIAEVRTGVDANPAASAKPVRQPIDLIAFLRNVFVTPQSGSEGRQ